MNIRLRETNFGVNIVLLFISIIIVFVSWLLKVDYFIYKELDPVYFSLTNNEDRFRYFIKQEFNFLLIVAGIILIYILINNVFLIIAGRKHLIEKPSKKLMILFILSFILNSSAVLCCGIIIPQMVLSFIMDPAPDKSLLVTVNHLYYRPIDIIVIIIFIQLIIINVVNFTKPSLYNKSFILNYTVIPYLFLPLFFI